MRILCFGDSNTWGYISGTDHERYDENTRWTRLLSKQLGSKYEIIEEGLNSRTFESDYPPENDRPGRNGFEYFVPCLYSQDKIDIVVLMLGTNDLKTFFNLSSEDIARSLEKYILHVKNYLSIVDKSTPKLIVSGIAPVKEEFAKAHFLNTSIKRDKFNALSKKLCEDYGVPFIDNSDLNVGPDGIHLTKDSHEKLAKKISQAIASL